MTTRELNRALLGQYSSKPAYSAKAENIDPADILHAVDSILFVDDELIAQLRAIDQYAVGFGKISLSGEVRRGGLIPIRRNCAGVRNIRPFDAVPVVCAGFRHIERHKKILVLPDNLRFPVRIPSGQQRQIRCDLNRREHLRIVHPIIHDRHAVDQAAIPAIRRTTRVITAGCAGDVGRGRAVVNVAFRQPHIDPIIGCPLGDRHDEIRGCRSREKGGMPGKGANLRISPPDIVSGCNRIWRQSKPRLVLD